MPITDLTNTTWVFNSTITLPPSDYYINYTCNNVNYVYLCVTYGRPIEGNYLTYRDNNSNEINVYNTFSEWVNDDYKTITITGGNAVNDTTLINWLSANAIQVPVADLIDTTWVFNDDITYEVYTRLNYRYEFDFLCDNVQYHGMTFTQSGRNYYLNFIDDEYDNIQVYYGNPDAESGTWVNNKYKTIYFNTSVTDSNVISFMQDSATYQEPQPVGNTYELTHSLTNLTHGNITLQITSDAGYTYPTTLTVTNGTLVSYDNTTGVAVISGDDTTVVSGECVEQASGYEVELLASSGSYEYVYVQINDDPTWYYAQLVSGEGFETSSTNIPNVYEKIPNLSIGIPNVYKIKIGTGGDPTDEHGPQYWSSDSTGDFVNLTFTSTGGSNPAYATSEITMTQDSRVRFYGND